MFKKSTFPYLVSAGTAITLGVGAVLMGSVEASAKRYGIVGRNATSSNVAACSPEPVYSTDVTDESVVASTLQSTAAVESTYPIYYYQDGDFIKEYPEDLQKEIYKQWSVFEGELPDYEIVLALWISESGLDPTASHRNADGTTDYGIPQLNTLTAQYAMQQGWIMSLEDLRDPNAQIDVGLRVLNSLCKDCPGGSYPYYRAIRAYGLGVSGLKYQESIGNYGSEEDWYEGPEGQWYPGKYGQVMNVIKYLREK